MPQSKKNQKKPTRRSSKRARPFYLRHWGSNEARQRTRLIHHLEKLKLEKPRFWFKERKLWQKLCLIVLALLMLWIGGFYAIARWYIAKHDHEQTQLGTTFIPTYAEYFDLDPKDTFHALIYDLGMRHIRVVSYWDEMEPSPGNYDFSQLDWQFQMAEQSNTKLSLAIGLRQPRWPECHMPTWAASEPDSVWYGQLQTFIGKVIDRYKNSPALQSYQLENEYFLKAFGKCTNFDRQRLINEFNFVKKEDPTHPVIVSRSNNAVGIPINGPTPDQFGVSVYKRVWDKTITHRYFEYPLPAWFYAGLAGAEELISGKDMIIHELQAEPWTPEGFDLKTSSIAEQNKSMDAARLHSRIKYGEATGMKTIDLWGSEWWYWRKVKMNDPSLWNAAKEEVQNTQRTNSYL